MGQQLPELIHHVALPIDGDQMHLSLGTGEFTDYLQALGTGRSKGISLADHNQGLDADDPLDSDCVEDGVALGADGGAIAAIFHVAPAIDPSGRGTDDGGTNVETGIRRIGVFPDIGCLLDGKGDSALQAEQWR